MKESALRTLSYNTMTMLGKNGLTKAEFCRVHGLAINTLERILSGQNIGINVLEQYAAAFDVAPWQLLKEGGV
ncbi:helix-turn-helix domain-containing protein [Lacticaseibacillus hegangensis]|uniref:Helix-turn-helix domain-containing protein n=1 Tax=Lacticaseibacillus hegangensis TaxID=2486010 RepID=A0ABW4CZA6_9LACO|nr:helix-turn-helix transcriptional regulator [Lacticaseibacillus hegangensis]